MYAVDGYGQAARMIGILQWVAIRIEYRSYGSRHYSKKHLREAFSNYINTRNHTVFARTYWG